MPDDTTETTQDETTKETEETTTTEETTETTTTEETPEALAAEDYELSLSENSLLEPSTLEDLSAYASENGLSNEAAQEMLVREETAVNSYQEAQDTEAQAIRDSWPEETKNDKEIGGENYVENCELSNRVFKQYGSEAMGKLLEDTGFGDHVEVVRTFSAIARALIAEDKLVLPGSVAGGDAPKTDGELFYGGKTLKGEEGGGA